MKSVYKKLSLRNKIAFVIIMMVVVFASLGFYLDFKHENEFVKTKLVEEKILTAKIVGSYAASDLAFENRESALVSLSFLESDVSIINVHLFNEKGRHFVSLYKDDAIPDLELVGSTKHIFTDSELLVSEPITVGGELFGYILIQASTKAYADDYERNIRYFLLLFLGLSVIVVVIAGPMASLITAPIHELVDAAKKVSRENDYITKVEVDSEDEIGELVYAFNEMLSQINIREKERDQANVMVKENEELLGLILNNMVIGVVTVDDKWLIRSYNNSAEEMFGYHESEILNNSVLQLLTETQRDRLQKEVDFYKATGSLEILSNGMELSALKKDGSTFPLYLTVADMINPKTGESMFIVSCEDISHKKLQDEQIRRTQRMDALGNLTGGVAHDYNNMLSVILGYTELLNLSSETPEKTKGYINEISHAAERAKSLTNKLLAFTKRVSVESQAVNINQLLLDNQAMIEKTLTVKIQLKYELDENLWNVWLDVGDLEDAIVNISINAMHAMENGGLLTFNSENIVLSEIEASALQVDKGEYVLLRVTDTGTGMDEMTRVRIFEPFFSTKEDKGTGLGLSQVYGFVKRAKGEVKVYSEIGKGTHFDFYFPRYHSETLKTESESEEIKLDIYSGSETILVVDDEAGLRALADELLSLFGYSVTCAASAEEALELMKKQSFDLMLSDVVMTGMDGYELAKQVREKYSDMKIQLASGFSDNWKHDETVRDLEISMLQKPYRKEELLKRVRKLLDQS